MAIINIHPFTDGNGRCARLMMNYELIKNNYPPVLINESQKLSYYAIIEEINEDVDANPKAYYFQQAQNGLYVREALIASILGLK